jgi:plastocyanin
MDPEQIYQEVLQEEQGKGSAAPVAEGRAKAARVRAQHGSPTPKEPKWWPGSQPHFEGNGQAAEPAGEAELDEEVEAPAEEAPAPAAEAPAPEPAEEAAATEVPPAQQPAPAPVAAAAETQPAPAAEAAPAAIATATELPPEQRPAGVSHGTPTGNRLRPEDGVSSEAQFDAQQAHYERRRLIDELVATGVPAVSAENTGRRSSPFAALLYLLIPLLVIGYLASQESGGGAGAAEPEPGGNGGGGIVVEAAQVAFNTDTLTLTAEEPTTITLDNQDSVPHNLSIYEDDTAEQAIFQGPNVAGGSSADYEFDAPPPGEYYFQCDIHPAMNGTAVSE